MSDGSGASGVLGVLVGAMLVIFVGAAILIGTGKLGNTSPTFTISIPGVK